MTLRGLLQEVTSSARASPTFSALFAAIALVVTVVVIILTGQAQAQREEVLARFDRPDLRTVTITDAQGHGIIPWATNERATHLAGVQQAWALGTAFEVYNGALPETGRASAQMFNGPWTDGPLQLLTGRLPQHTNEALAPQVVSQRLGFDDTGGYITDAIGRQWAVVGTYRPTNERGPSTILVEDDAAASTARSISFLASNLQQIDLLTPTVASLTEATTATDLSIDRAENITQLQSDVAATTSRYGRTIVITVMATSYLSLALLSILMVHIRRQEFGRRRALGASRFVVVLLVVLQGGAVVAGGGLIGLIASELYLHAKLDTSVSLTFAAPLLLAIICGSAIAQIPSALAAGFRDPVKVLRTP